MNLLRDLFISSLPIIGILLFLLGALVLAAALNRLFEILFPAARRRDQTKNIRL